MKQLILAIFMSVSIPVFAKEKPVIVFGVNSDYAMPLISVNQDQNPPVLEEGILKDLGEALAKELNFEPKWFLVPKRRVAPALIAGRVDILCHLNEAWQSKIKDEVWWSNKLYRSANLLVSRKDHLANTLKDIYGSSIGVVLNFVYSSIDPLFESGVLKREDGPNNVANIQKLLKQRIDYIVMSNLEYSYYKKEYPVLTAANFELDTVMTKCAVSKKSSLRIEDVNRAISTIQRNGILNRILRTYYIKE